MSSWVAKSCCLWTVHFWWSCPSTHYPHLHTGCTSQQFSISPDMVASCWLPPCCCTSLNNLLHRRKPENLDLWRLVAPWQVVLWQYDSCILNQNDVIPFARPAPWQVVLTDYFILLSYPILILVQNHLWPLQFRPLSHTSFPVPTVSHPQTYTHTTRQLLPLLLPSYHASTTLLQDTQRLTTKSKFRRCGEGLGNDGGGQDEDTHTGPARLCWHQTRRWWWVLAHSSWRLHHLPHGRQPRFGDTWEG